MLLTSAIQVTGTEGGGLYNTSHTCTCGDCCDDDVTEEPCCSNEGRESCSPCVETSLDVPHMMTGQNASTTKTRRGSIGGATWPRSVCISSFHHNEEHSSTECIEADVQFTKAVKVHLMEAGKYGVRGNMLMSEALHDHPYVTVVHNVEEADYVFWLTASVRTIPREAGIPPQKLVVVDENDGPQPSTRVKSGEFVAYFKRSFVVKVRSTKKIHSRCNSS
jgi:hypothetical protein